MTFKGSNAFAAALAFFGVVHNAGSASAEEPVRCTVVLAVETGNVLHQQGSCDHRAYPMSTFKLPLAMMGYDAGILVDDKTPRWEYQQKFNAPKRVQKATDPTIWQAQSVVWYSQELTRRLGEQRFHDYVESFAYGNGDVTGGPGGTQGLTESWLMSSLEISPNEQVDFLRRFLRGDLLISTHAVAMTQAITPRFDAKGGWTVHGKTGSGRMRDSRGKADSGRPIGWFVGWAEKQGRRVVFARLLVDAKSHEESPISFVVRDTLIADLPEILREN